MSLLSRFLLSDRLTRRSISEIAADRWLDLPSHVESAISEIRSQSRSLGAGDLRAAWAAYREETESPPARYETDDGVAIIHLSGHLMKTIPCAMWFFGVAATSTSEARRAIREAIDDPDVSSIALVIDSPGGTLSGLAALADDIRELREIKPINAYVPDLACSAAYWIAAQCSFISAGPTATIGSIGVYVRILDLAESFADDGIKVHVVSSGPRKGDFVQGAPVKDDALAREQELIDEVCDLFVDAIVQGRLLDEEKVRELATGDVWHAQQALELGLIDGIESDAQFFARVRSGEGEMLMTSTEPVADAGDQIPEEIFDRIAELEARNAELIAERRASDFLDRAAVFNRVPNASREELARLLDEADRVLSAESNAVLDNILHSVQETLAIETRIEESAGSVLAEEASPIDRLNLEAAKIKKLNPELTAEQAFLAACERNPDLYQEVGTDG